MNFKDPRRWCLLASWCQGTHITDVTGVVVSQGEDWPCQPGMPAAPQVSEMGRSRENGRSPHSLRLCVQFPKASSSAALSSAGPGSWKLCFGAHKSIRVAVP